MLLSLSLSSLLWTCSISSQLWSTYFFTCICCQTHGDLLEFPCLSFKPLQWLWPLECVRARRGEGNAVHRNHMRVYECPNACEDWVNDSEQDQIMGAWEKDKDTVSPSVSVLCSWWCGVKHGYGVTDTQIIMGYKSALWGLLTLTRTDFFLNKQKREINQHAIPNAETTFTSNVVSD